MICRCVRLCECLTPDPGCSPIEFYLDEHRRLASGLSSSFGNFYTALSNAWDFMAPAVKSMHKTYQEWLEENAKGEEPPAHGPPLDLSPLPLPPLRAHHVPPAYRGAHRGLR